MHIQPAPSKDLSATYRSIRTRATRRGRLFLTVTDLATLMRSLDPRCEYCRIDGRSLRALRLHDRFGRPVRRLTLTLIDETGHFLPGNLEWACAECVVIREFFPRNAARRIGLRIAAVWLERLEGEPGVKAS
jgi:hypothetical protein